MTIRTTSIAPAASCARGFSLVEVMVALVIIAIGMLGIAKMQALALSSTGVASERSLAAIEAASLASAMHANRAYWASTPASFTTSGTAVTVTNGALPVPAVDCTMPGNQPCSSINLAGFDVQTWIQGLPGSTGSGLGNLLPNATSSVVCSLANTPLSCTIQISWTENAVAINQQEAVVAQQNAQNNQVASFQNPTYTLYVEP